MDTQVFHSTHSSIDGKPHGGESIIPDPRPDDRGYNRSPFAYVKWQQGPLGRGEDRIEPNGAFVETVIRIAADRIRFYQSSPFACTENANALDALEEALRCLASRTARREAAGVEGTHEVLS